MRRSLSALSSRCVPLSRVSPKSGRLSLMSNPSSSSSSASPQPQHRIVVHTATRSAHSDATSKVPEGYEATAAMFSQNATKYATSPNHKDDEDLLIVASYAQPTAADFALDVATGAGHTALKVAQTAGRVIGVDIADGMLEAASRLARERNMGNVIFQRGLAEDLRFEAGTFDLVTCRIAPHHFKNVPQFVREVSRVLKPGGRFVLEDSMSPADPTVASFLEKLEWERDNTHVHSLTRDEWFAAVRDAGLEWRQETLFRKKQIWDLWVRRTGLGDDKVAELSRFVLSAPASVHANGLFTIEDGQVKSLNDEKLIFLAGKSTR